MATKSETRQKCLATRKNMAPDEVAAKSRAITERLKALDEFRKATTILCYVSSKDNEADTHALIESLLAEGRTVLVPVADREGILLWSRIEGLSELAPARFGILEPRPECRHLTVPPAESPVVVPGIAFTPDGCRIGYGEGYYDRFLAHHPGPGIALAFEVQIVPTFDRNHHDIAVDTIVTEQTVYRPSAEYGSTQKG